jgi:uncharacterized protein
MDNIAGTPVEGINFHGREADIARLVEVLRNDDVLLLGARRIGKTSIARAVMALLMSQGWKAVEINVAKCQTEYEFIEKLEEKLTPLMATALQKAQSAAGDAWSSITKRIKDFKLKIQDLANLELTLREEAAEDWTKLANDCLKLIASVHGQWLIYVDELPIMLYNIIKADPTNGIQRARRFLDWFRNDVRAQPEVRNIRWLVSGSVGLDTLVQQYGMADTINSFRHEKLPAYTESVALAMLDKLAARYALNFSTIEAKQLIEAVMWRQPYYLQLAFNHLRTLQSAGTTDPMPKLIQQTIELMSEPGADNDFHHWESRLEVQLGVTQALHCRAMLTQSAQQATGTAVENLFALLQERLPNATHEEALHLFTRLRDILERDSYWWADEQSGRKRYRFHLEPLRRWWLRRNSL